jgi:hypothetical protein
MAGIKVGMTKKLAMLFCSKSSPFPSLIRVKISNGNYIQSKALSHARQARLDNLIVAFMQCQWF